MPIDTVARAEHPSPAGAPPADPDLRGFRRIAIFTAIYIYLLIIFGGTVRITGSGMGCGDEWPLCNGQLIPTMSLETFIEWMHRLLAAGLVVPLVALAVHVLRRRGRPGYAGPGGVARPIALAFALLAVQVMLGAITVWLELSAAVTALHFVTAATILACVVVAAMRAGAQAAGSDVGAAGSGAAGAARPRYAAAALFAAALGFLVIGMGAVTANTGAAPLCTGFPLCNGQVVPVGGPLVHIHWTHRLLAYLLALHVVGSAIRARVAPPAVRRSVFVAVAAVAMQIVVAAALVIERLPRWLQVLHLAVGAAVWVSLVVWATIARRHDRAARAA